MPDPRRVLRHAPLLFTVLLAIPLRPDPLTGQEALDEWAITSSFSAGIMWHDWDEDGEEEWRRNPFFAFRTDYVVSDLGVVEFGLGYAQPEQAFGRSHFAVLEGQFQIRWPLGDVAPFAGMGGGIARTQPLDEELDSEWNATFTAGVGIRAWLDDRTQIRTDGRYRGVGASFDQTAWEWTFGLGFRW